MSWVSTSAVPDDTTACAARPNPGSDIPLARAAGAGNPVGALASGSATGHAPLWEPVAAGGAVAGPGGTAHSGGGSVEAATGSRAAGRAAGGPGARSTGNPAAPLELPAESGTPADGGAGGGTDPGVTDRSPPTGGSASGGSGTGAAGACARAVGAACGPAATGSAGPDGGPAGAVVAGVVVVSGAGGAVQGRSAGSSAQEVPLR